MVIVIIVLLVKLEAFLCCCALSFGVLLDRGVGDNDESPFYARNVFGEVRE